MTTHRTGRRRIYRGRRRLDLYLTDREYRAVQSFCDKKAIPMTQMARRCLLAALKIPMCQPEELDRG